LTKSEGIYFLSELHRSRRGDVAGFLDLEYICLNQFIGSAFIFENTTQGYDYWANIRDSKRDGIIYNPLEIHKEFIDGLVSELFKEVVQEKNNDLDNVLSELKISKQKTVMTKLTLDINPYLRAVNVSARINGVEERNEFNYESFDNDFHVFFMLGEEHFMAKFSYTDGLHVEVYDDKDVAIPFKLKTSK
jgi:hypothetical protein